MYLDKNTFKEPNWYLRGEDRLRRTPWLPYVQKFPVSLFPMVTTMEHVKISVGTLFQLFLSKQSKSLMEKKCPSYLHARHCVRSTNLKARQIVFYVPQNLVTGCYKNPQIQACDLIHMLCGMSRGKWYHLHFYWTVKLFPSVHPKTSYFKGHMGWLF